MSLRVSGVSKGYGRQIALQDIDLTLDRGVVALLGANGSGKSTLLRLLATLDHPDKGVIQWQGREYRGNLPAIRQQIGYLPQTLELPDHLTPHRLLHYLAQMRYARPDAVERLLSTLNLQNVAHQRLGKLSGGQLRLVGIAQALLGHPELLLLDELSTGLDVVERERVYRLLAACGQLTVFSTHVPTEAQHFAQTVIVLHYGRVLFQGSTTALRAAACDACYEVTLSQNAAQHLMQQTTVSRVTQCSGAVTLRVISAVPPVLDAKPVEPSLEDAYLFLLIHKA